jgi:hypothetical protein
VKVDKVRGARDIRLGETAGLPGPITSAPDIGELEFIKFALGRQTRDEFPPLFIRQRCVAQM